MRPHHKKAIENLKESIKKDERFVALIIGGSVAKGMEREDSDIDVTLIATDEEFEKRKKRDMYLYYETKFCDYPGGYVDGKCFKVCIYGGLKMKKDKALIKQENCLGCGRCEMTCPQKAISISIDDYSRINELIARFESRVDISG
ncbi:unnamed protein product [marine sediment metagenome]|uniref:4Fe-4S ferredoxin-type domain-containing protein n=1 Tax=marine sediment metagenome TaxID=412755 RepID=X1ABB3_9ZZZZ